MKKDKPLTITWGDWIKRTRQASELGAIQTGDMVPPAATVKLSYLLANQKTRNLQVLKKLFVRNYCGEIS